MSNEIKIGNRVIGDGHPCFITFEAGPTHSGLESAKRLVKHTADAGADAVKFQIFRPDNLVADRSLTYTYQVLANKESGDMETVTEPLYNIFVRRHLADEEWLALKAYADSLGLAFFATIGDDDGFDLVQRMDCHSIKVASADVNHHPFIRKIARTGVCIQLDTGSSSLGEIEAAVDLIQAEGNHNIVIHNCPSGYPARLESINLRMIPLIKQNFGCPAAFSDHTPGWEMDVAAVAMGANLVEKTITEDRCTRSVEHVMSLEPPEMSRFVKTIREVEVAMGSCRRVMTSEEREYRLKYRRSVYLEEAAHPGQRLDDVRVSFKRPGYGLQPDQYEKVQDYLFRDAHEAGDRVELHHLMPSGPKE